MRLLTYIVTYIGELYESLDDWLLDKFQKLVDITGIDNFKWAKLLLIGVTGSLICNNISNNKIFMIPLNILAFVFIFAVIWAFEWLADQGIFSGTSNKARVKLRLWRVGFMALFQVYTIRLLIILLLSNATKNDVMLIIDHGLIIGLLYLTSCDRGSGGFGLIERIKSYLTRPHLVPALTNQRNNCARSY